MKIWIESSSLKKEYVKQIVDRFPSHEIVTDLDQAEDAEVAVMMPTWVKPEILNRMKNLKLIKLLTAGYNQIDLSELKQRNIKLAYAKDVFSIAIAEDVIAKMLYFNRRLGPYHDHMKEQSWTFEPVSHEIYGSTIGIVGAGSIGDEVAKRLKAFHTHVIGYRRTKMKQPFYDEMVHHQEGLMDLVRRSDFIIVSIPLTKDTYHMFNQTLFQSMKQTALFINVARGEIVDQDALINALNHDVIRGAALDVTTPEPLPKDHPLWRAKNIFITPHQASASPKMHERLILEVIDTLNRYLVHDSLENIVSF